MMYCRQCYLPSCIIYLIYLFRNTKYINSIKIIIIIIKDSPLHWDTQVSTLKTDLGRRIIQTWRTTPWRLYSVWVTHIQHHTIHLQDPCRVTKITLSKINLCRFLSRLTLVTWLRLLPDHYRVFIVILIFQLVHKRFLLVFLCSLVLCG